MSFLEILNKRYATKAMNGEVVPQQKIDTILEAIRLAPSSSGLQPFEVFVITDNETKIRVIERAIVKMVICVINFFIDDENKKNQKINKI